nr:MAG TPA: hypothetical protein [Caudoviricetes sp.]
MRLLLAWNIGILMKTAVNKTKKGRAIFLSGM